ncbi:unnamed protein product [Lampetra fluviatilis]
MERGENAFRGDGVMKSASVTRRPGTDRHARRHANLDATWNAIGGGAAPGARHNPPCDVALAKSDPRKNHIGRDTRYCARSDL